MKSRLFLFVLLFLFWACKEEPTKVSHLATTELKAKVVDSTRIKDSIRLAEEIAKELAFQKTLISNANVVEKLTAYGKENPETKVKINTKYGSIKIKLFEDTPLHRANFIMLIKKGYFDSTLFYRVIENFMIQGGNSDTDDITEKMRNIGFYQVPNEVKKHHIHRRGALAMAVTDQWDVPERLRHRNSSPYNFYIIQKGPLTDKYMDKIEKRYNIKIPSKNRSIYKKYGGNPHLDNQYTVFGQVYSGMRTVDKISKVLVDQQDRPVENIYLTVEIIE